MLMKISLCLARAGKRCFITVWWNFMIRRRFLVPRLYFLQQHPLANAALGDMLDG